MSDFDSVFQTCPNEGCGQTMHGWGQMALLRRHRIRCDKATPAQRTARLEAKRKAGRRSEWDLSSVRNAR